MPSFHALFRAYLDQRKLTIYRLSKELQIDRSTLYQVQSGARLPTAQIFHRMVSYLRLSAQEERQWLEAWKRERLDPRHYQLRQQVEQCIQALEQYAGKPPTQLSVKRQIKLEAPPGKTLRVEGQEEIIQLLQDLIESQACAKKPGMADIHLPVQLFSERLGSVTRSAFSGKGPRIRQLFSLPAPGGERLEDLTAMINILNSILGNFFAPQESSRYTPYFYYENGSQSTGPSNLFPYYVITGQCLLLLSEDQEHALFLANPQAAGAYREQFEAALRCSAPLFRQYHTPIEAMKENFSESRIPPQPQPSAHFFRQPCLVMYTDPEIVSRAIHPDFPEREKVAELVLRYYIDGQVYGPDYYNFFTRQGAEDFLRDGVMREFPGYLVCPLPMEDRRTLIRRLRDSARLKGGNIHCVNEQLVSVPEHVVMDVCFGDRILFARSMPENLSYLMVSEPSLVQCFLSYFRALPSTPGVMGREESAAILDELLARYS